MNLIEMELLHPFDIHSTLNSLEEGVEVLIKGNLIRIGPRWFRVSTAARIITEEGRAMKAEREN